MKERHVTNMWVSAFVWMCMFFASCKAEGMRLREERDIQLYKHAFMTKLAQDPHKKNNRNYPFSRVILTISCPDADMIPSDPHAGEIVRCGDDVCQIMHNGIKVVKNCYYGQSNNWMTDIISGLRGLHEPQEEKVFHEVLKYIPSQGVMLELGSYWAYYSLWFASTVKEAKNYLIEPCMSKLLIGKKNFDLNKYPGHFLQGYVGVSQDKKSYRTGESIVIDTFLEREHIDHLHLLHSDIQGAEFFMLQSCVASIQNGKIDFFFISTHGEKIHAQCMQFFLQHDLEIIAEHTPSESYSCDGLIVAQRKGVRGPGKVTISKFKKNI